MGRKSIYRDDIIRLRSEGKKYKEIHELLGCTNSIISYYTIPSERNRELERGKKLRVSGEAYKSKGLLKSRNKQIIQEYLQNHPCIDCGNSDIRVLEFDHVRGIKKGNISHAMREAWSIERLQLEIDKCEVRCCNCHRIVTRERKQYSNKTNILNN